ncbi:serine dehydrogenase proteinase domain protein [Leptospira interrogans serovar Grippotyphosa str. LT2186]|uniref:Serine dehydrogenase proteinase domain protein n=3 Tax=Leptospira interrogans TaxID=173 RepID=M3H8C4_LEPIR|nr:MULTISPECIES: hypothetical protein [Leptospira]EMG08970.1 serine dehydrogenase proteinase domain protein [Leptospira interrogans serovar Grippotyphosa str. LT2186]EKO67657.1 serine dehydrogenase proteinase domain protein [Leptospira interrogans serovar Canicola str. Fiocruz LV133]EKO85224.1 serine dehydrogenase proteinase domain protein [Leptospira interrogans serovar Grippotyphosa str. Andaman]EKP85514.1 serine dehydrogenase proteinase domain protein [Leptospira interrogans serovar Grippoty
MAKKIEKKSLEEDYKKKESELWSRIVKSFLLAYGNKFSPNDEANKCSALISEYLNAVFRRYKYLDGYNVFIHYDRDGIDKSCSDLIYESIKSYNNDKPLLYILYSKAGELEAAYLVGNLLRKQFPFNSIVFAIPRVAKSAGTLLCCIADEIHMGSLSELSPIMPNFRNESTSDLKNSLEYLAELVSEHPKSSELFAKYLSLSIDPSKIYISHQVDKSTLRRVEGLLKTRLYGGNHQTSNALMNAYDDYGPMIDSKETKEIFGHDIVKLDTEEYRFSNEIYLILNTFSSWGELFEYEFSFIGSLNSVAKFE